MENIIDKTYSEAIIGIKEEWFVSELPYWYRYVVNLSKDLQVTYLTIMLEHQVFHQYFVNF